MPKILKQYTKFLFPFQYKKGSVDPSLLHMENKKGVKQDVFERFSVQSESLREGLDLMLSANGKRTKIADCYQLNVNCRKKICLPPRKSDMLSFDDRRSDMDLMNVAITELKLYLFESQVGFVEVECEYDSKKIDTYIELNYFICEVKSEKNHFIYHEKAWDPKTRSSTVTDISFSMKELLENVFKEISLKPDAIQFSYYKSKPLIYSHLLMDEEPDDIHVLLQRLAKNYKQSYKFDDSCAKVKTYHPFENSYWVTTLNGAVNISFLSQDEVTNDFFANNFYTKTKGTYFFLFLNVIHQRYAIIRFTGKMGDLDRLTNNYYIMEKELKTARRYEAEAINLKFRGFFKLPSSIEHVNEYYEMLCDSFQVDALYKGFSEDIKSLQSICGKYVERIKERDEKLRKRKKIKMEIFVSILAALVAEVTLFNNSWSLFEKVLGHTLPFWSPGILILLATLISPLITIAFNVSKQVAEIKDLSKQIDSEVYESLVENDNTRKEKEKRIAKLHKRRSKKSK